MDAVSIPQAARTGTLTDVEICDLAAKSQLIVENFEAACVKQASYELRAGKIFYWLTPGPQRFLTEPDGYILLKPRQLTVIITMEKLAIPANTLGRILTKGKLFSVGLLPVNTYADPGFKGRLGIVLFNSSTRYLKIAPGQPIAKIEFARLAHSVADPYYGQHGYETEMWPVPTDMILSDLEIKKDPRISSRLDELELAYGADLVYATKKVVLYQKRIWMAMALYLGTICLLLLIWADETNLPLGTTVAIGLLVNIATAIAIPSLTRLVPSRYGN